MIYIQLSYCFIPTKHDRGILLTRSVALDPISDWYYFFKINIHLVFLPLWLTSVTLNQLALSIMAMSPMMTMLKISKELCVVNQFLNRGSLSP